MARVVQSEVKGTYFVTARSYVLDRHGEDTLSTLVESMPPDHRVTMRDPFPSTWYPEVALRDSMAAFADVVAGGDLDLFESMMEECIVLGANRFFRVLLSVTTADFALRNYPTMCATLRRGPSTVEVQKQEGATFVTHHELPFADDPRYHRTGVAGLRGLLRLTTKKAFDVRVVDHDRTRMRIRVAVS